MHPEAAGLRSIDAFWDIETLKPAAPATEVARSNRHDQIAILFIYVSLSVRTLYTILLIRSPRQANPSTTMGIYDHAGGTRTRGSVQLADFGGIGTSMETRWRYRS